MSGEEPIELPALSAHRRGPSAAVCASGHVFAWSLDPEFGVQYCPKCGDPILTACPTCERVLPADGEMLQWVPYYQNCLWCGKPYPWKAAAIERAKRTLAEQAQVEHWSDAVRSRADELVEDIAADRAVASGVVAALNWLGEHGAQSATATILDTLEPLASAALKQGLRPTYPGLF